jgi:hypothetical protein
MSRSSVPAAEAQILDETVTQVCGPGATWTGSQRRSIAMLTREAAMGGIMHSDDLISEIVARLTLDAKSVSPTWIASVVERGVGPFDLVELLGIVSRTVAIDTFCFALGVDSWRLPDHFDGDHEAAEPNGAVDCSATCDGGWLPTVGPAWPTNALSAVPSENQAMHQLNAVFYMAAEQMGDLDVRRGLHRTQMELVATRTSLLNECFF